MQNSGISTLLGALLQRDTVKVLTLTQPWATLMALEVKRIETRSWGTPYRGPVAIHAAKSWQMATTLSAKEPFRTALEAAGYTYQTAQRQNPWNLPLGQILAVGMLDEVQRITPAFAHTISGTERAFGQYAVGRSAWCFSTIYRLKTPIQFRGTLGLWEWCPPEAFWHEIQAAFDLERESVGSHE